MSALGDLYGENDVNLDATVVGMAAMIHNIIHTLRTHFGYSAPNIGDALESAYVTLAYKLGDITDDSKRALTQKAISDTLGFKVRPRNRNAKSRVRVPNTPGDSKLIVQIMTEGSVAGDETLEQAQERLNALAGTAVGTEARQACFAIVQSLVGPFPKIEDIELPSDVLNDDNIG